MPETYFYLHCSDVISNDVVQSHTGQPLLSDTIRQWHLFYYGHLCHTDTSQDNSRPLQACIWGPPKDWRHRTGRTRQKWLRMAKDDLSHSRQPGDGKVGTLGIERHGDYLWRQLHLLEMLRRERGNTNNSRQVVHTSICYNLQSNTIWNRPKGSEPVMFCCWNCNLRYITLTWQLYLKGKKSNNNDQKKVKIILTDW